MMLKLVKPMIETNEVFLLHDWTCVRVMSILAPWRDILRRFRENGRKFYPRFQEIYEFLEEIHGIQSYGIGKLENFWAFHQSLPPQIGKCLNLQVNQQETIIWPLRRREHQSYDWNLSVGICYSWLPFRTNFIGCLNRGGPKSDGEFVLVLA